MKNNNSFTKSERIVSQKLIDELFIGGQSHSLTAFPLRAVFLLADRKPSSQNDTDNVVTTRPLNAIDKPAAQLLLSVPKRRFRHAVDRNRVKRQLREAYRNSRPLLTDHVPADKQVLLAFIWMSDRHFSSAEVAQRVKLLLTRIASQISVDIPDTDNVVHIV